MVKVSFEKLVEMLGEEYERAIESLFCEFGWEEDVELKEFLVKWTEAVIQGTEMAIEWENEFKKE